MDSFEGSENTDLETQINEPSQNDPAVSEDAFVSVSQRDYIPTPYRQSQWEGIENYDFNAAFHGISLDVIASDEFRIDPMFEVFEGILDTTSFKQYDTELPAPEDAPIEIPEELLEAVKAEAFEAGTNEGLKQAEEHFSMQLATIREQYDQKIIEMQNSILESLNERTQMVEKKALELALAVSKKILETTVEAKPDYIYEVIKKAIFSVPGAKSVVVKVSPEDYEFISIEGLPHEITEMPIHVSYQADESIVSGCVIESEFGMINLEIDTMWGEIRDNLYKVVKE